LANNGIKIMEGQDVRLLSIPADAGKGLGSFDTIHQHRTPKVFAERIAKWAAQNQGVAAEAFLKRVTTDLDYAIQKMNETRAAFAAKVSETLGLQNASGLVTRALGHFAIIAAAGELATEFGTTGWPAGEAPRALAATFEGWFLSQHKVTQNVKDGVKQVREWIEANIDRLEKRVGNDGRPEIDIPPELFRRDACAGFDHEQVARHLKAEGDLAHNDGRLTLQRRDGAQRYNVYCVRVVAADTADRPLASKAAN
jgi:putative DNA primase/helicase